MFRSIGYQQSLIHILMQMSQSYYKRFKINYTWNFVNFFSEHPVGLHVWHYPQPTWPIPSSAMPRHKLILHIAVALCSKPSGSGCKVLLKCYQLKTVMLKVSLILTCLTTCLHVYETEDLCYLSGNDSVPCSISVSYKHILIHVIF